MDEKEDMEEEEEGKGENRGRRKMVLRGTKRRKEYIDEREEKMEMEGNIEIVGS